MSHINWSDLEKGMNAENMRRVVKALEWLSNGHELEMAGRTMALVESNEGKPHIIIQATMVDTKDLSKETKVALGAGSDLLFIFDCVSRVTDEQWAIIAANVALNEGRKTGRR